MPSAPQATAELRLYGDAVLRRSCREVRDGEDVSGLAARMLTIMRQHSGVGLAAPQIGDPRRVIAISDPGGGTAPLILVNPRLKATFGPEVGFEEGCLSFPELFVTVTRPRGAEASYRDLEGRERCLRDEGVLARVLQHELDHLEGVLFIDRLPWWRRWLLTRRLRDLRRRGEEAA
jgi:peptide deformylase